MDTKKVKAEVSKIVGHGFEGKKLFFKTEWVGWPKAAFTWQDQESLVEARFALGDYCKKIGIFGLTKTGREQKLKETAEEISYAAEGDDLKILKIVSHRVGAGRVFLTARWSNGEEVEVEKKKFPGAKKVLAEYMEEAAIEDKKDPDWLGEPKKRCKRGRSSAHSTSSLHSPTTPSCSSPSTTPGLLASSATSPASASSEPSPSTTSNESSSSEVKLPPYFSALPHVTGPCFWKKALLNRKWEQ